MKRVATVVANLMVPGSAQVVLGRPGWGVVASAVFGLSVGAVVVGWLVWPGFLGRWALGLLSAVAAGAWVGSQWALLRGLRRDEREERRRLAEGLEQAARLWLRGRRGEALRLLEALVDRWPREPALHFALARLRAEDPEETSSREARRHLAICRGCDPGGRWQGPAERLGARLRSTSQRRGRI